MEKYKPFYVKNREVEIGIMPMDKEMQVKVDELETAWKVIKELDVPKSVLNKLKTSLDARMIEVKQLSLFKE